MKLYYFKMPIIENIINKLNILNLNYTSCNFWDKVWQAKDDGWEWEPEEDNIIKYIPPTWKESICLYDKDSAEALLIEISSLDELLFKFSRLEKLIPFL